MSDASDYVLAWAHLSDKDTDFLRDTVLRLEVVLQEPEKLPVRSLRWTNALIEAARNILRDRSSFAVNKRNAWRN